MRTVESVVAAAGAREKRTRMLPSRLTPPKNKGRPADSAPIIVRVVKYHLFASDGTPTETFHLISILLDADAAPAAELVDFYYARWQIQSAFGAFKSQLKGDGVVLRSKTPYECPSSPPMRGSRTGSVTRPA